MTEKIEKLETILEDAFKIFSKNGIRNISMDDLCRNMNISKKTLYKYVVNKADLIQKISDHYFLKINSFIEELQLLNINAIDFLLEVSKIKGIMFEEINPIIAFEMKKYYPQIMEMNESRRKELITNSILQNLEKGIKEGLYREDLDKEIVAHLYYEKIEGFHNMDFEQVDFCTFDQMFEVMFENHIRGISNQKGIEYFEKEKKKLNFNV